MAILKHITIILTTILLVVFGTQLHAAEASVRININSFTKHYKALDLSNGTKSLTKIKSTVKDCTKKIFNKKIKKELKKIVIMPITYPEVH